MRNLTLTLLFSGLAAMAQEGRIQGPISAYFYDEATQSVRSLVGVPGAGYFSPALARNLEQAAVSPNGKYALGISENQVVLLDLEAGTRQSIGEGASQFAWNAASTAAAVVRGGQVSVWKAERNALTELGAAPEALTSLTVDRAGRNVYVAAANGITRYSENGEPRNLASAANAASLALSLDGAVLYAVDKAGRAVLEINTIEGGAAVFARDAVEPTAVALSPDGKSLFVTDGEGRNVLLYDRATRSRAAAIELGFAPTRLSPIGEGIYMLNARTRTDAMEVMALAPTPSAFFVPAPQEEE